MTVTDPVNTLLMRAPDAGGAGAGPSAVLDMTDYFSSVVEGTGLFHDRFGRLRLGFDVTMSGRWDGDVFRLAEDFRYDDGRIQEREWRIRRQPSHKMVATSDEIIGEAQGQGLRNEIRWRYRMHVPVNGRQIIMSFDDRMYLRPDGSLLNISEARIFGLLLGRLTAVFRRT